MKKLAEIAKAGWTRVKSLAEAKHMRLGRLAVGGLLLFVVAPVIGLIPGPGGIFFAAAGALMIVRESPWAQKKLSALHDRFPQWSGKALKVLSKVMPKTAAELKQYIAAHAPKKAPPPPANDDKKPPPAAPANPPARDDTPPRPRLTFAAPVAKVARIRRPSGPRPSF